MKCLSCSSPDTKVVDSRISKDGLSIRRRRECEVCEFRFSTEERLAIFDMLVQKRDETQEQYNSDKIVSGLKKALEKRSYTQEEFYDLLQNIELDIYKNAKNGSIATHEIGDIVMKHLIDFDKVAYIRFASVYRGFDDIDTFQKEINTLSKNKKK